MSCNTIVSVIVPCFQQGKWLRNAIECLLNQTYQQVEIVVVNDGSNDETDAVASAYPGVIRYITKTNGGLSSARNAGIEASTGRYLLFLDADDELHREAIEVCVKALPSDGRYSALMGFQDFRDLAAEDGKVEREWGEPVFPPQTPDPLPAILTANLMPVHCWLVPKALVVASGGFECSLRSHEDWDLWSRLCLRGMKTQVVPFGGAYYRRTSGSMSTNRELMTATARTVFLRICALVLSDEGLVEEVGSALLHVTQLKLRFAIAKCEKEWVEALKDVNTALRSRGAKIPSGWARRMVDRLLGDNAEFAIMQYFRVFENRTYRQYLTSSGGATRC